MNRSLQRSDEGAILIFALIVVTTVALVAGALLARGWGNFAATVTLRDVAGKAYAADAAAKVAVTNIVQGAKAGVPTSVATYPDGIDGPNTWVYDNNTDGTGCFGKNPAGTAPLSKIDLSTVYTQTDGSKLSATVVCTPVAGTGLFGSGGGTIIVQPNADSPFARALTTVGTAGCTAQLTGLSCDDGVTFKGLGSGTEIPVRGSIQSKTGIRVEAGTLHTNGTIVAVGGCTFSAGGAVDPACVNGPFVTPATLASPLTSVPTWIDPTTQGCDFHPGFYNNGQALSDAVNACDTGANPFARFRSGKYYFDFADGQPWTIDTTVIGGELTSDSVSPGRCVSPILSPTTDGVQFVFGGSSFVAVEDGGHVELCGPANGGQAPLTIYQQQTGSSPSPQIVPTATANKVTTVGTGKNDAFTAAGPASATFEAALSASGNPRLDWKSSKDANTGELDLQNFPGLSGIPVGATITSAKLNVTYTSGLSTGGTFAAGVTGQAATVPVGASSTDTDITAILNAQFLSSAGGFSATNPTVRLLLAGSKKNDTFSVDAVNLKVTYVPAALRGATSPKTFITDLGGNFKGTFVVQGATYAPNGYISLTPGCNTSCSVEDGLVAFRWGVLAWGGSFKSLPAQAWGYPLISIPDVGYGLGSAITAVDLKVFVCSGTASCPTTGPPDLTSRVQFTDGTDTDGIVHPVAGQRQVNVLSWAEQR